MKRWPALAPVFRTLAACAVAVALLLPSLAPARADAVFPVASKIGLVPPPGLKPATAFPGFENPEHDVFIRLAALPAEAFGQIETTVTDEALKKQGLTVEKRDSLPLPNGNGILLVARQDAGATPIRKWLLIAPLGEVTAMASFEMPATEPPTYSDAAVRAALASVVARPEVPVEEQLVLLPFKLGDISGLRVARVVPGAAVQLTDGPKDALEAVDQPQLLVAALVGGPQQSADRDRFARDAFNSLPPLKDVRIISAEPLRFGGQTGHEIRAQGKDPQSGAEIEIVQWLRFGNGAYLRLLGYAPKDKWTAAFTRFRTVRDDLEPR